MMDRSCSAGSALLALYGTQWASSSSGASGHVAVLDTSGGPTACSARTMAPATSRGEPTTLGANLSIKCRGGPGESTFRLLCLFEVELDLANNISSLRPPSVSSRTRWGFSALPRKGIAPAIRKFSARRPLSARIRCNPGRWRAARKRIHPAHGEARGLEQRTRPDVGPPVASLHSNVAFRQCERSASTSRH